MVFKLSQHDVCILRGLETYSPNCSTQLPHAFRPRNSVDWKPSIWRQFCTMAVDPSSSWPKYWVYTLDCFFVIYSSIFHFLQCRFVRLVITLSPTIQLAACLPTLQAAGVRFPLMLLFNHRKYNGFDHVKFNVLFNSLYLFSFCRSSRSRMTSTWDAGNKPFPLKTSTVHVQEFYPIITECPLTSNYILFSFVLRRSCSFLSFPISVSNDSSLLEDAQQQHGRHPKSYFISILRAKTKNHWRSKFRHETS
jgi:hypothetical protein